MGNISLLSGMIYIFTASVVIVLAFTIYLLVAIRIHRNDVRKAKRQWDDSDNIYL